MTNTKDTMRTRLEEAAGKAGFTHNWSGRTKISNFRRDGWRLAVTWDDQEGPASLTAYMRDGKAESPAVDAILAEQHPGGSSWLYDVVARFFHYQTAADRLELLQDAAVPASDGPVTYPAMTGGDQPHPDRGNALELLEQVSAEAVREDEQAHIIAVAEASSWLVHDYPVGSDWDRDYLSKMNLGMKGFFDKVYRFTSADTADVVSVFFLRHQVYGAHLDSPGRQAFRSRGDNRSPWITDTVARWLVNPTDTLADGRSNHDILAATLTPVDPFTLPADQADQIPNGAPFTFLGTAAAAPLGPMDPVPMTELDAALASNVQKLIRESSEGLPQRKPGEFWPTVEPEDSDADKAEHRARHLAADMFTSYWDARDADMFDADDVTHLLELLAIARKAGR
ncbi:hypothetical protein [Nocardia phage NBR1]|uniref:hypothetical protein n=1 Tax=Nocardia phage NBR1 TaxID=1109711 RepID=UPI00023EEDFD|nr:hypothetical protein NoPhNBR1_gp58 [Nocardia phage NBR1]AEV52271.1 hypothetical protein [Nocardia phage NBR1]